MDTFLEYSEHGAARRFSLGRSPVKVGRGSANEIRLSDCTVSRSHLLLECSGSTWIAVDLGAINGTQINGSPLTGNRALHDGDELRIGETRLRFHSTDEDCDARSTRRRISMPEAVAPCDAPEQPEFFVLGPLEIRCKGQRLHLGGAKQRLLIAALALECDRVVASARLIELMWGREWPRTATNVLQQHMTHLEFAGGAA